MQASSFHLLDQSCHPPPRYSIKCVNKVAPVEYSQQAIHRPRRISRPWLDVFSQDPPGVLKGTNEHVLVRVIHNSNHSTEPGFKRKWVISFPKSALGGALLA